ncbi:slipin family protein [Actibacterium sp. 188UL27-1]|uniref:slipin family protein n=1 Tax=Actibacterium sp. 188UL27-1 TaxID=2786961 RepID=UPI001EF3F71E|nr:slipin family protein [Actibacterium sp. 188UL27-1]
MTKIERMIKSLLGYKRLIISETERALVLDKGRLTTILTPGEHWIKRDGTEVTIYQVNDLEFQSSYEAALFREKPDLAAQHLTDIRTGSDEVAIVSLDAAAHRVMGPDKRLIFWTDAGAWTVERLSLVDGHGIAPKLAQRLMRAGLTPKMTSTEVSDGKVGLLSVDGVFQRKLEPGTYWFWNVGRKHLVKLVDIRWQAHEVTGQEILTKDRVTIRVNLTAEYRVTDPVKAATAVKDFVEALHRALQLAFRKTLGALTLDKLLADKVSVDAEAAGQVRTEMAEIGIEVGEIALKDVILPGEMREILNQVVAAEKQAEANVIRRREETNATRSLLNTAKVMAENPVMLRLKELEALEAIAGKVERLTVHNGTEGLMSDIVRLRD